MHPSVDCPKVIVIEDDHDIRQVFQELLEGEGYAVEAYESGQEALDRLTRKPEACLILLDMMMPGMDGAQFMAEFAKLPATIVPIPVYLCSAVATAEKAKAMDCRGFIKKPVDLNVLLLIVQQFCRSVLKSA
jgi:CheY-like chemotaxis protein